MTLNKKAECIYRVPKLIDFEFRGDSGVIDKTQIGIYVWSGLIGQTVNG